jgi:hypothetical protein
MESADDRKGLAAVIFERTGLKIDQDDPVFVLVELNRVVLQQESARAAAAVTAASEAAHARMLATADAWAAQSNEVLARFAFKTEELRRAIEEATGSAPPSPAPLLEPVAGVRPQLPGQESSSQYTLGLAIVVAVVVLLSIVVGFGLASTLPTLH